MSLGSLACLSAKQEEALRTYKDEASKSLAGSVPRENQRVPLLQALSKVRR